MLDFKKIFELIISILPKNKNDDKANINNGINTAGFQLFNNSKNSVTNNNFLPSDSNLIEQKKIHGVST